MSLRLPPMSETAAGCRDHRDHVGAWSRFVSGRRDSGLSWRSPNARMFELSIAAATSIPVSLVKLRQEQPVQPPPEAHQPPLAGTFGISGSPLWHFRDQRLAALDKRLARAFP
jgi:hypothetical protein